MSTRGFIKYVEKRMRKVLRGDVKVEIRRAGTWSEHGFRGKWLVNYFRLTVWVGNKDLGLCVECSSHEEMVQDALDCLIKSQVCRKWLRKPPPPQWALVVAKAIYENNK